MKKTFSQKMMQEKTLSALRQKRETWQKEIMVKTIAENHCLKKLKKVIWVKQ